MVSPSMSIDRSSSLLETKSLHLSAFNLKSFIFNQSSNVWESNCSQFYKVFLNSIRSCVISLFVTLSSCTKKEDVIDIYILNKRGPKMEPCGMPDVISDYLLK